MNSLDPIIAADSTLPSSTLPSSTLPERKSYAWLVSLLLHLAMMIVFSLCSIELPTPVTDILLSSTILEEPIEVPNEPPEEFRVQMEPVSKVGASSLADDTSALSTAIELGEPTDIPTPDQIKFEHAEIEFREMIHEVRGLEQSTDRLIKGSAGFGVSGAEGAVDQITKEILTSLEERKTLVVWFFDQSASLIRQRERILSRFDRIYEELGVIKASGSSRFARHDDEDALLTLVVTFGHDVSFPIKKPTADYEVIRKAVHSIPRDDTGDEFVFTALQKAITRVKKYRKPTERGEPDRNVMFVVVSDEAGDDQELLDQTTTMCVNLAIPVYVIGVPAPFGTVESIVKWVDPDPKYNQRPQRGRVRQGPESLLPELVHVSFSRSQDQDVRLDSGFGPFALTRLARASGGQYFAVHPNREKRGTIRWKDVPAYSSHLAAFFDEQTMRHYRPDYVSAAEYQRAIRANAMRQALVQAALATQNAQIEAMARPQTRFVRRDEASLANALSRAQRLPAAIEPQLEQVLEILQTGEKDREREAVPRWQAGFDLAMGRVLAAKARIVGYNLMLAEIKRGKKFKNPKNNTWVLKPSSRISVSSNIENTARKAELYLKRVVQNHSGTPWAHLAKLELADPFGWEWTETYTNLARPRSAAAANNNNNRPPADEQRRMLERKKTRPVPRL